MQIVINIDDDLIQGIMNGKQDEPRNIVRSFQATIADAIKYGTPLPKGHGDLIDRSKIYKAIPAEEDNCTGVGMTLDEMDAYNDGIDAMYSLVHGAPTIIEADKGGEE